MVLGWIKGSENPSFCYRVEHGKEATYQLKLQNINVRSNKFHWQHNPGVFSKLEVTYYPACGYYISCHSKTDVLELVRSVRTSCRRTGRMSRRRTGRMSTCRGWEVQDGLMVLS